MGGERLIKIWVGLRLLCVRSWGGAANKNMGRRFRREGKIGEDWI